MISAATLRIAILPAIVLFGLGAPVHAASSVYTEFSVDKGCENAETPDPDDEITGDLSLKCKGYKDYAFYFKAIDARESASFGYLSPEIVEGAYESFMIFNDIGDKIEWRLDDKGVPRAAILRYTIRNINPNTTEPNESFYGQVLVISRVGQPDDMTGCVTAYVDALENKDANELARKLADEQAPNFACGKEKPDFHGKKGDKVSAPVNNYPEPKIE